MEKLPTISDETVRAHVERDMAAEQIARTIEEGESRLIDWMTFGHASEGPLTPEEHAFTRDLLMKRLDISEEQLTNSELAVIDGVVVTSRIGRLEMSLKEYGGESQVRYHILKATQ